MWSTRDATNEQESFNGDLEQGQESNESTPLMMANGNGVGAVSTRSIRALPGMKIRAHAINASIGSLKSCEVKEALSRGRAGKGPYWIDIDADDRDSEELAGWLEQLKVNSFLLSRLAEPSQTWASQVLAFPTAVLAVIRILPAEEASDEFAYMAALSTKTLLLTFTSSPRLETGGLYANALAYMHAREKLPHASSSGALFGWLQFHVERTSRCTRELRSYVLKMDASMDRDITSVELDEIIEAKDQLLRLLSVAEEQMECLEALAGAESDTEGKPGGPACHDWGHRAHGTAVGKVFD